MTITELPPFTPKLEDYRAEEFLAHTLSLLAFPVELDQHALDMAPFVVKEPPRAPEPPVPLLPHIWYPRAAQGVTQAVPRLLTPPRLPYAFFAEAANSAAEKVMKPLLAGSGMQIVQGEAGIGKTMLLLHIANHERTKQRFRRIWWFEDVERVGQLAGIALGMSHVLAEPDPVQQLQLLQGHLGDATLIIVDNLTPEHPLLPTLMNLSPFVLLGLRIPPEILEEGTELPADPPNVVTLRKWSAEEAVNYLAQAASYRNEKGIIREIRPLLDDLAQRLAYHPLHLALTVPLLVEDRLPLDRLLGLLDAQPDILTLSIDALPAEYRLLLEAFGAFSPLGVEFDPLVNLLGFKNELVLRRGLTFLWRRRLLNQWEERYTLPLMIYERMMALHPHKPGNTLGDRARQWVVRYAESFTYDSTALFWAEHHLRHLYQVTAQYGYGDIKSKLNKALNLYLSTYITGFLPLDAPPPRLIGERAQAVQLARQGLDTAEKGDMDNGRLLIDSALQQLEIHGSDHDRAEALVMLGRVYDLGGQYAQAAQTLEKAAKLVYDLNAEASVSVIRLGLAIVYRHLGRLREALAVLDETPEAYSERARVFRAMGNLQAMSEALSAADMSPYAKAESYLQAQHYGEALEAIAYDESPASHYLRALIYHLQEAYEQALTGYDQALRMYPAQHPERANVYRAIASIHAIQGNYATAENILNNAMLELNGIEDPVQRGRTLSLMAAVHLCSGANRTTVETAGRALKDLLTTGLHADIAETYRTLGRACWRLERYEEALKAFVQETEFVQTAQPRREDRIGIAFFHAAEAYRICGQVDRAVANHRRALTHITQEHDPLSFFMIQTALYRALAEQGRHKDAEEVSQAVLASLYKVPPPDLQYLGYTLGQHIRILQAQQKHPTAYQHFSRWMTTLTGRADALTDEHRPMLALLALSLATRSLLAIKRAEEAVPLAEEAVRLAEQYYPSHAAAWAARRDYGELLLALGYWQTAHQAFTPLLSEVVQSEIHTYAAAYEGAGYALHQLGDDRNALNHYWTALDHQPNAHQQGLILERVGTSYLALGETERCIENYTEAMKFLDRKTFPGDTARVLTSLAHTLAGVNRYADAIGVYEDALAMLRSVPDASPVYTARVYVSLGRSNEVQGQLKDATKAYQNALEILEKHHVSAPDDHRMILLSVARVLVAQRDYLSALPYFERARDAANDWGTPQEVGTITCELAEAQRDGGRLDACLLTYRDALDILHASQFPQDRATVLRSYGKALSQMGRFDEARTAWNEAIEITGQDDPIQAALTHHAIGQAYRAQKDYASAENALRQAIAVHKAGTVELAATHRELGEILLEARRPGEAVPALQVALEIEKTLPQQSNGRLVNTLELLGQAEELSGARQNAIARYHAALVYMDRAYQPIRYADTLRRLGQLYMASKAWDNCQKALGEAIEIELNLNPRDENRLAQTFRMIADAYHAEGHLEKAATAYKKMATHANLSTEDAGRLRSTLQDIDRHKATIRAALESMQIMERTGAELKNFAYLYALMIKTHYLLSEVEQSRQMMDKLMKLLNHHQEKLDVEDERTDYRSLANLRLAWQYEAQQDRPRARDHYRAALKDNSDNAMGWVIERGLEAVI